MVFDANSKWSSTSPAQTHGIGSEFVSQSLAKSFKNPSVTAVNSQAWHCLKTLPLDQR